MQERPSTEGVGMSIAYELNCVGLVHEQRVDGGVGPRSEPCQEAKYRRSNRCTGVNELAESISSDTPLRGG
jgi:hypothetical protein